LNSSCQDIVVARTLLGNVTARKGSGGIHYGEDVVCVAEIDTNMNFFQNFFEGDVEFRCCKVVDNRGGLNLILECDIRVQRSNWYKAFYVVLNFLTFFVGVYSPALLFVLPDYIIYLRKECKKEQQEQEEEKRLEKNGYQPIPSSREITIESTDVTHANAIDSEGTMLSRVRRPATLAEDHTNVNEEPNTNESVIANEANGNEASLNDPNLNSPNSNESILGVLPNSTLDDKVKDEEERKIDELPVDDGSPVNISTLLYACASAKVFRHYSTKLSFNIKLAFLWFCVIPFPVYIELALSYTLKDEFVDELGKKDTAILTGGLFIFFKMNQTASWVILIISYVIIPLQVILILKPKDLSEEPKEVHISLVDYDEYKVELVSSTVFIGDEVLERFQKIKKELLLILSLGKVPIRVYQAVQNCCDRCKKTGARRLVRLFWVFLALISSICAVICSLITAAICLFLITVLSTILLVAWSPYCMILWYFRHRFIRSPYRSRVFFFIIMPAGLLLLIFSQDKPLLYMINPITWLLFAVTGPFFLVFSGSSRFVIKMCGYTIMGLIYNADIAAPIAVFFATLASYLRDRCVDSKNKCKRVKEIISQEWQRGITCKDALDKGKLDQRELKLKVPNDAIPKRLFWYVCDGDEYQEFPLEKEALRLLRDVVVIFCIAFLAICAIFFSANSYKISTVASTIAVFVSAKIPMVLLRETDHFNGWKKIKTKRIIREAVGTYIEQKRWRKPANKAVVAVFAV